jgi:hypothetical protein
VDNVYFISNFNSLPPSSCPLSPGEGKIKQKKEQR